MFSDLTHTAITWFVNFWAANFPPQTHSLQFYNFQVLEVRSQNGSSLRPKCYTLNTNISRKLSRHWNARSISNITTLYPKLIPVGKDRCNNYLGWIKWVFRLKAGWYFHVSSLRKESFLNSSLSSSVQQASSSLWFGSFVNKNTVGRSSLREASPFGWLG